MDDHLSSGWKDPRRSNDLPNDEYSRTGQHAFRIPKLSSTYDGDVNPERETVTTAAFDCKMIGVHSSDLTGIVSGLIGILVIHVVWDTNL